MKQKKSFMLLCVTQLHSVTSASGICSPLCLFALFSMSTTTLCSPSLIPSLTSFFCLYLSCLSTLLCLNTETQTGTEHISQLHRIWVKATQGPLKLGRFPTDTQSPKSFLEGCMFVCVCVCSEQANKPVSPFLRCQPAHMQHHRANNSMQEGKKGKETMDRLQAVNKDNANLRESDSIFLGKYINLNGSRQMPTFDGY